MRATLSAAAATLLRSIMSRAGLDRNRMTLGNFHSVDWQSLTFTGERHELSVRLPGPDAIATAARLRDGIADGEWPLDGHVVVDILITGEQIEDDGSILVSLEALTLIDQASP